MLIRYIFKESQDLSFTMIKYSNFSSLIQTSMLNYSSGSGSGSGKW